jgi:hypothetical protein
MIVMTVIFSSLDLRVTDALVEFNAIMEADIRAAHGEIVERPRLSGVPEHIYIAAMCSQDEDQKAHDAEVDAQRGRLQEP